MVYNMNGVICILLGLQPQGNIYLLTSTDILNFSLQIFQ